MIKKTACPTHIFFSCFSEEFGSGKEGEEIKAAEEVNDKAVGRYGAAVINCPPAPPVPVVLYEIKVTEEVKNSEPISKQKRVQDWINEPYDRAVGVSENPVGQAVINGLPAHPAPVVLYESQGHLQPLEDPSVILTSPQFPKKKYTESKIINSLKLNPFCFVAASET